MMALNEKSRGRTKLFVVPRLSYSVLRMTVATIPDELQRACESRGMWHISESQSTLKVHKTYFRHCITGREFERLVDDFDKQIDCRENQQFSILSFTETFEQSCQPIE